MLIRDQKTSLRANILKRRQVINPLHKRKYDLWVCDYLLRLINDQSYQTIHTYLPMRNEIDVYPLIEILLKTDRRIIVPKTLRRGQLEHYILSSIKSLKEGIYGTFYPEDLQKYDGVIDLIIVPGLAFGSDGYRVGYGGGYYDRFLSEQKESYKLGVAYPFQMVNNVPRESFDVPLDEVVVNNELVI